MKKQGIRLVYGVQDDALIVMVMAVDKREEGAVYQSVMQRVSDQASSGLQATKRRPK